MQNEKNDKVLAMYYAVASLLDEGKEIHTLKVSDITTRAGIGKGTAYEYFKSKEELLAKAICYHFAMQFQKLYEEVQKNVTFKAAMNACFEWMEENAANAKLLTQYVKLAGVISEKSSENWKSCIDQCNSEISITDKVMDCLIEIGKKERCIHESIPVEYIKMEILSKLFSYFSYAQKEKNRIDLDKVRCFLTEGMKRVLSQPI